MNAREQIRARGKDNPENDNVVQAIMSWSQPRAAERQMPALWKQLPRPTQTTIFGASVNPNLSFVTVVCVSPARVNLAAGAFDIQRPEEANAVALEGR